MNILPKAWCPILMCNGHMTMRPQPTETSCLPWILSLPISLTDGCTRTTGEGDAHRSTSYEISNINIAWDILYQVERISRLYNLDYLFTYNSTYSFESQFWTCTSSQRSQKPIQRHWQWLQVAVLLWWHNSPCSCNLRWTFNLESSN